jgi:hypothetical protein
MMMLQDMVRHIVMELSMTALSALGTRTDAVHPVAGPLDALRDEITFATNSKKSISLATRPPSSSNMNDTYLHTLAQSFLAPDSGTPRDRSKPRECRCDESVHRSKGGLPKHRAIEVRIDVRSADVVGSLILLQI